MTALRQAQRIFAPILVMLLIMISANTPAAQAVSPPSIDPNRVPAEGKPSPDQPMRQSNVCARTITVADPNVADTAPGFVMLNIAKAWEYSTGNGVVVAVIDTGVNPSPRLPVIAGGDYITGGDGLMDCDAHGTIVASVIGAAPQGIPMPAPMPKNPAFPTPPGPPPTISAPPPPGAPPPPAVLPTPTPVTITETQPAPAPPPPPDEPANGPGTPTPDPAEDPEVPPPPPGAPDGVVGVAPHATILSIRQSSRAYEPVRPAPGEEARRKAGTVATLASAIVHAANMDAKVINVSVTSCVPAADSMDQTEIGAAVWYAATVKDAVVIAAAGNEGEQDCAQNPSFDPLAAADPRDWHHVKTISSPS